MATPHFLVFVGAGAALSAELGVLAKRFQKVYVVAPAARKSEIGVSEANVAAAMEVLASKLKTLDSQAQPARLTVWTYHPGDASKFKVLWQTFGSCGWIELIPSDLINKVGPTRIYIQDRIPEIFDKLHDISYQVYNRRKSSPLPLPFGNFRSKSIEILREYWYNTKSRVEIGKLTEKISYRFRQLHTGNDFRHRDDRSLCFEPAKDTECHGIAHPVGTVFRCFVNGRFRFGTALFPGFHYEVTDGAGRLTQTLIDCIGRPRHTALERRTHINIFPNDYLLPEK